MEYQPTPRNRLPPYRTHSAASPSSGPISSTGSRYRSQLLRESTFDSKETTHIASDFLRSALERERACRRTTLENNDKLVRSSPVRAATADPSRRSRHHRGASLEGNEHHCPLGAKEASEVCKLMPSPVQLRSNQLIDHIKASQRKFQSQTRSLPSTRAGSRSRGTSAEARGRNC